MTLRDYQQKAIEALYAYLRECRDNPVISAPTGSGKSLLIAQICKDVVDMGGRAIVLAHVKELLEQNADKIRKACPELLVGIYSAGLKSRNTTASVIVAGIQSVYRRACEFDPFDIIIIDEAHRLSPDDNTMYRKFITEARTVNPNVRIIGLTATPYRLDSGPLCSPDGIFNAIAYEIDINTLIEQGYLCKLYSKRAKHEFETAGLHIRGGEFVAEEVEELVNVDLVVRHSVQEIIDRSHDRKSVLIFAASVAHGQKIVDEFQRRGIECGYIVGDTADIMRSKTLERFQSGELKYLCNVGVLTTGYDCPTIDLVAILRPTMSPALFVQMVGRGLRIHPQKTDCIILDFGQNFKRHGPIDAIKVRTKDTEVEGTAPCKECPECGEMVHASILTCPSCGHEFPPPEKKQTATPSSAAALSKQKAIEFVELDVIDTRYSEHRKRGADDSHPRTLRVDYVVGRLGVVRSEWVCLEHEGFAREKAVRWWRKRSNDPCPRTVSRALEVTSSLARTLKIRVKEVEGEKFPEIVDYMIDEIPPGVPDEDLPEVMELAEKRREDFEAERLEEKQNVDPADIPF